jgi:hypothetical protein
MEIDPEALSRRDLHRLPNGMVVPRPMSWVTSVSTADVCDGKRASDARPAPVVIVSKPLRVWTKGRGLIRRQPGW